MKIAPPFASSLFLLASLCACGGGGGGGTTTTAAIQGIAAPGQISVVTADPSSSAAQVAPPGSVAPPGDSPTLPVDSDFYNDKASAYVYDPSMDALATVNSILCETSLTAYDQMVNLGDYMAQIDLSLCSSGSDQSSEGSQTGQSSGANGGQYDYFTVNSSRASNESPQIVNFWVPQVDNGQSAVIFAQMTITQGADSANPFGEFSMNFARVDGISTLQNPLMFGTLATTPASSGTMGFSFFFSKGDIQQVPALNEHAEQTAVSVEMAADQSTGTARVHNSFRTNDPQNGDSGIIDEEYLLAFNSTHVKRQKDNDPAVTLSRSNFHVNTWRYNLYEATGVDAGKRVEINSGFPFHTAANEHGYIGYYGLWTPEGVTLNDGDTIYGDTYDGSPSPTYTLVKSPGKLIKYTRNTMLLTDLGGQSFSWFDWQGGNIQYQVECQGGVFFKTATWDQQSQTYTPITPVAIDVHALGGWLNMWSQSLGGSVSYVEGDTAVTYYEQHFINASDPLFANALNGQVPLYGFMDCLRANMTGQEVEQGAIYLPNAPDVSTPNIYRFDQGDLTLYYDSDGSGTNLAAAGLAPGQAPTGGPYMWGMRSGPMLPDASSLNNVWEIWSQPEFYEYETGHNSWNQYASVLDDQGDAVVFDAPIQFTYTHLQANDANDDATYDGQRFMLQYGGPGNLWGIPQNPIDMNGDGQPDRWLPKFSIKDGVVCGPTGSEYLIRGIQKELTLQIDPAGDPGLSLLGAAALVLPTASGYLTPNMGAQPVITDPPAVINGVVQ